MDQLSIIAVATSVVVAAATIITALTNALESPTTVRRHTRAIDRP